MTVQTSKQAIELRRLGYSYADIARELKVSRSSVCGWVKNVRLTENEKALLQKSLQRKMGKGRMNALISIRSRNVFKDKTAYDSAEREFAKLARDPFFMFGIGLYSNHGVKGGGNFQFTSMNPEILIIMKKWLEKYLQVPKKSIKYRIFIAISHKDTNFEQFWLKNLSIQKDQLQKTIYLKRNAHKSKEYQGSMSIVFTNIGQKRKLVAWQKLTMRYYV